MDKRLTLPEYKLILPDLEAKSGFSLNFRSSRSAHCDLCRLRFSDEVQDEMADEGLSDILLQMGEGGDFDDLIWGTGSWEKDKTRLLILDDIRKLWETRVKATFLGCRPQEIVRYILTSAGVNQFHFSDEVFEAHSTFSVDDLPAVSAIQLIGSVWGIEPMFYFRDGIFYWGTEPRQEDLYELDDGNVLSLEKENGFWIAETVGFMGIRHSQYIRIAHADLTALGLVEECTIQAEAGGMTDMWIKFAEVPEDD